jgi:hypothetical protein
MAKKRTVRPFYTKPMQRLEAVARTVKNIEHSQVAFDAIEQVRQELIRQHALRHPHG